MEMTGRYELAVPVDVVWDMINDRAVLERCIPGCEELTEAGPGAFQARVRLKVGPVKATFHGDVQMTDIVHHESFRLGGEGKGGVAGMATGYADVRLEKAGVGTVLTYEASAEVAGKIAQLGSRLIDSTAKKLADRFFSNFEQEAAATVQAEALAG